MINLIQEKSGLFISENFQVLQDSVIHTEGAFDLDYTFHLNLKYQDSIENNIVEQIKKSTYFDTLQTMNYGDSTWNITLSKTEKGIWTTEENGFRFLHSNNEANTKEPFNLKVDTSSNNIDLIIIHL